MKHKNRFLYQRALSAAAVLLLFYTINTTPAQTCTAIGFLDHSHNQDCAIIQSY